VNRIFKRYSRGEKGFTLVELLIVFTLLAVLAAIMIPNVAGFVQYGHTQAAKAELSVIQTAMDAMMAKENITSVTGDNAVSDWSAHPTEHALYPDFLRFASSNCTYDYDNTGLVSTNATGF
jgi:prepilin-type N-terminal cleavage/methylation domain-containing protein